MLHILLGLLKIIGMILAVIIGLILLVILVVLFAAFRYKLTAAADGDIKSLHANVKFSWFFHLISGFVTYQDEKIDWQVKIAWKKLNAPKVETAQKVEEDEKETVNEVVEETTKVSTEEVTHEVKEETERIIEAPKPKKVSKKEKTKKEKKKESFGEKIRCSIQKISDKIKEIKAMKDRIVAFLTAEAHKKAFQKLLKELLRLLKKMKPKKLKANVTFGCEDPYKTGSILAYLSMLYPFYGDNINVTPNFTEATLKGDIFIKGHVRISYMVSMGIHLILEGNVRLTIKEFIKLIAKNKK